MTKTQMPETVAVVTPVFGLYWAGTGAIAPMIERTNTKVGSQLITTDQAEAYAADKVREALEEEAQTCEARIGTGDAGIDTSDCDEEAQECAVAIRALIPKEPP